MGHLACAGFQDSCPWQARPAPPPTAFLESQSRVSAGPGPEASCGFRLRPFLSFLSL